MTMSPDACCEAVLRGALGFGGEEVLNISRQGMNV